MVYGYYIGAQVYFSINSKIKDLMSVAYIVVLSIRFRDRWCSKYLVYPCIILFRSIYKLRPCLQTVNFAFISSVYNILLHALYIMAYNVPVFDLTFFSYIYIGVSEKWPNEARKSQNIGTLKRTRTIFQGVRNQKLIVLFFWYYGIGNAHFHSQTKYSLRFILFAHVLFFSYPQLFAIFQN